MAVFPMNITGILRPRKKDTGGTGTGMRLRDASLTKYSTQLFASEDLARTAQRLLVTSLIYPCKRGRRFVSTGASLMKVVRSVPGAPKKIRLLSHGSAPSPGDLAR